MRREFPPILIVDRKHSPIGSLCVNPFLKVTSSRIIEFDKAAADLSCPRKRALMQISSEGQRLPNRWIVDWNRCFETEPLLRIHPEANNERIILGDEDGLLSVNGPSMTSKRPTHLDRPVT